MTGAADGGDGLPAVGLGSLNRVVLGTAVALALPLGFAVGATEGFAAGFLLLMLVGVLVPALYERDWPEAYESAREAAAWTVAAGLLLAVVYLGLLVATRSMGFGERTGPALAFVTAWLAGLLAAEAVGKGA